MTDFLRALAFSVLTTALFALLLCGCGGTRYVAVPEYHYSEVARLRTDTVRDSLYHYDSVWVETRGDTVYQSRYRVVMRDRWRSKVQSDTVIRVDSIRVPYPVERSVPRWQQAVERVVRPVGSVIVLALLAWIAWRLKLRQ